MLMTPTVGGYDAGFNQPMHPMAPDPIAASNLATDAAQPRVDGTRIASAKSEGLPVSKTARRFASVLRPWGIADNLLAFDLGAKDQSLGAQHPDPAIA
jgi:hypothetical protein